MKAVKTFRVDICMAGDIEAAKQVCREFCFGIGWCVRVDATTYIYTGGEERGFVVHAINYARFSEPRPIILRKALKLAARLATKCCQKSYSIVSDDETTWHEVDIPALAGSAQAAPSQAAALTWIVDLIRNEYDKAPSHYKVGDTWDDGAESIARKIIDRLTQQGAAQREGWKLAPREPTQEMLDEVTAADQHPPWNDENMRHIWQAMYDAAPAAREGEKR